MECGVFKYTEDGSNYENYSGCSDSISVKDTERPLNSKLESSIESYTSEVLRETDYTVFSTLLTEEASQLDGNSNLITECYNVDNLDEEMTYKLSSLYNIDYPLDYDADKLRLLVINYPKIMRVRSQEDSYYMMLRVLERSETDLYNDDSDDSEIKKIGNGRYKIHNSRIQNAEFAIQMLKKVTRTGISFEFDNSNDHVYTMEAVTIIKFDHGNSFTDDLTIKDDLKSSSGNALIMDKRGESVTEYPY